VTETQLTTTTLANSSSSSKRHAVRAAAIYAAAVALWFAFHLSVPNLPEIWLDLRRIGPAPALVGIASGLGVVALQAARWWFISSAVLRIRYRDALAAILVGAFFNVLLPARAGDALRVDDLSRRVGVSRATLFGTELIDFVTDKAGWLPAFLLLLGTGKPPSWLSRVVLVLLVLLAMFALLAFALRGSVRALSARATWLGRLATGILANRPWRLALAAFVVAAAPWLFEAFALRAVAAIAAIPLSPLQAFAVLTAFNVATVVPTPGGLGPNEAASTAALLSLGVPSDRALMFAVMYHATQLVPALVVGGLLLLQRRAVAPRVSELAPVHTS